MYLELLLGNTGFHLPPHIPGKRNNVTLARREVVTLQTQAFSNDKFFVYS